MRGGSASLFTALLIPLVILLVGISFAAAIAIRKIPPLLTEAERGMVPPGFEATLSEAGEYTVWLHRKGRLGNTLYEGSGEIPPGGKIFLFDAASGREMEIKKAVAARKNMGEDEASSIGVFTSVREGQAVEVKGSRMNTRVLVSIAYSSSGQIMKLFLLIAAVIGSTLAIAGVLFVKLMRRHRGAGAGD